MKLRLLTTVLILLAGGSTACSRVNVFLKTRQLRSSDASKRRDAATGLGRLHSKEAVEPLIAALADPDAGVSREAAQSLGLIGDPRALDPLVRAFPKDKWGQQDFAKGLCYLGQSTSIEPAIPVLVDALRNQGDILSSHVELALGTAGAKAVEPVRRLLDDPDPMTRKAACGALVAIGMKSAEGGGIAPAVPRLVELLRDPNDKVRSQAANALGRASGRNVVEALIQALGEPDEDVREAVAVALMSHHDEAVDDLIAATRGDHPGRRLGAARALEMIDTVDEFGAAGKKARGALDAALDNDELEVVAGAREYYIRHAKGEAELLAALRQDGSRKLALDYLNSGNEKLADAARDWAKSHGYEVTRTTQSGGTSRWGKRS